MLQDALALQDLRGCISQPWGPLMFYSLGTDLMLDFPTTGCCGILELGTLSPRGLSHGTGDCMRRGCCWGWGWDGDLGSNYVTESWEWIHHRCTSAVSKGLGIPLSSVFTALVLTVKRTPLSSSSPFATAADIWKVQLRHLTSNRCYMMEVLMLFPLRKQNDLKCHVCRCIKNLLT